MAKVLCYSCKYARFSDYEDEDKEPIMYCTRRTDENGNPISSSSWIECDEYEMNNLYD